MMLLEPAFGCAAPAVPELLAQVLAKLYAAFPPGTEQPPEVGDTHMWRMNSIPLQRFLRTTPGPVAGCHALCTIGAQPPCT